MSPLISLMLSFLLLDFWSSFSIDLFFGFSTRTAKGSSLIESNKLSTDVSQVDSVTQVLEPRIDELLGKNKGSSK
jgi:hypothetical protein